MKDQPFGLRYLKNVVTLSYDAEKCMGCGRCEEVCPHRVFDMQHGKAQIVDRDLCIECGACSLNCPVKAISVDAGVGCAAAFLVSWLTGKEPSCGSSDSECC